MKIPCAQCNKLHKRTPAELAKNNFCSKDCYNIFRAIRNNAKCDQCGIDFYRSPGHQKRRGAKKIFCSQKCMADSYRFEYICLNCNISHNRRHNWKFCSMKCYVEYTHTTGYKRERFEQPCKFCGKILSLVKGFVGLDKFCGRECADKYHSIRMTGKSNSNFIHGNSAYPYPAVWNNALKKQIRDRDSNTCQLCGITQEGYGKRLLHVHHIDWNKDHTYLLNLITLCHPCHRKCHQKKERLSKELLSQLQERAKFLTESIISE